MQEVGLITGHTRLVAIVGSPVAQVKSPANFNAHFACVGADIAMIPMNVLPAALDGFVALLRGWENLAGCVVTVPYKQQLAGRVDCLSDRAAALGAINVVRREPDGRLVGDMTDGLGFLRAAQRHGFAARGRTAMIAGAGGAGSAIAHALCEAGIARLIVLDRDDARAESLAARLLDDFPWVDVGTGGPPKALVDVHADLLVNATPAGMADDMSLPLPAWVIEANAPGALVADVVTSPELTQWLALAVQRGCKIQTGAEMAHAQMPLMGAFMNVMTSDAADISAEQGK
ncbi:shikimate dehydrogenase [Pandoraea communis]|uniref:shikimate dehydrogenase (NADP(+)) n=1 Tax=Pandoraea communis TaxID=2508297 RepID=A0A5E4R7R8_9BURK|nr:shikimate dehydrogenase [Pandoraea communis]